MPTVDSTVPPDRLSAMRPHLLTAAAALAVVSLGLPWNSLAVADGTDLVTVSGTQHAVRVLAPLAALGVWWGLTRGSRTWAWAGLACAVLALPLQPSGSMPASGRLVFAVAILLTGLALASGASRRDRSGTR
jgi:hypothetical protein